MVYPGGVGQSILGSEHIKCQDTARTNRINNRQIEFVKGWFSLEENREMSLFDVIEKAPPIGDVDRGHLYFRVDQTFGRIRPADAMMFNCV
jgi:hypothetical protein